MDVRKCSADLGNSFRQESSKKTAKTVDFLVFFVKNILIFI